jgi:hypothetical protein
MNPVPYNRSLNGQRYMLWIFTNRSLAFLFAMEIVLLNIHIPTAFGFLAVFSCYQAYLRFGKPPGHDEHTAVAILTPRALRPGKAAVLSPIRFSDEKI